MQLVSRDSTDAALADVLQCLASLFARGTALHDDEGAIFRLCLPMLRVRFRLALLHVLRDGPDFEVGRFA